MSVPLGLGLPYWVDDPEFDIEFHLREVGLPSPGSDDQLAEQVARIHARPLDRTRPLWEMYLIHNVEGGRQALYSKVHHAAIDGTSGAEILATILDATVEPRIEEPPDEYWTPEPLPSPLTLLQHGLSAAAAQPAEVLTHAAQGAAPPGRPARCCTRPRCAGRQRPRRLAPQAGHGR